MHRGTARQVKVVVGLLLTLAVAGCEQKAPAPAPPKTKPTTSAAKKPTTDSIPVRFPEAPRVVAIGDVHGDLAGTRAALKLAGAIDDEDEWIGGKLVVVQTGDQLDRGDEERAILELLAKLERAARQAGGALHVLLGNHEIMNALADFRYVTPGGFRDFRGVTGGNPKALRFQPVARGRASAFLPGGQYAKQLAGRNTVAIIGDTAFAHGGVLPAHVDYGLARLNSEVRAWLRGDLPKPPSIMDGDDAPIWTRQYSDADTSPADCKVLEKTLDAMKVKRMVVGHTTQKDGVTAACGDRVWRIDVGISAHYGGRIEVLEIAKETTKVEHGGGTIERTKTVVRALKPKP